MDWKQLLVGVIVSVASITIILIFLTHPGALKPEQLFEGEKIIETQQQLPDLTVEEITYTSASAAIKEGDEVTIYAKIGNKGRISVTNPFDAAVYVDGNFIVQKEITQIVDPYDFIITPSIGVWEAEAGEHGVKVVVDPPTFTDSYLAFLADTGKKCGDLKCEAGDVCVVEGETCCPKDYPDYRFNKCYAFGGEITELDENNNFAIKAIGTGIIFTLGANGWTTVSMPCGGYKASSLADKLYKQGADVKQIGKYERILLRDKVCIYTVNPDWANSAVEIGQYLTWLYGGYFFYWYGDFDINVNDNIYVYNNGDELEIFLPC